jgi:hypothetical protein
MSTFEDMLKVKDETHAAAMEYERKRREEIESLVLSLQRNYNAGHQPDLETDIPQPRTQLEGPASVSAGLTDGVPVASVISAPDDVEMRKTGASGDEIRLTPLTPATEHSATGNSNHQHKAPIPSEDDEMRDTSPTTSKWKLRSGKERYVSVHSSDEDDPEFRENFLDDDDDMNLVSLGWVSVRLCNLITHLYSSMKMTTLVLWFHLHISTLVLAFPNSHTIRPPGTRQ